MTWFIKIGYFNGSTLFVYFFKYSSKFHEDQNPPACIFYKRSTFLIAEERSVMQVGKSFPELWKGYVFFLKEILPLFIRVKSSTSQLHLSPLCPVFPIALSPTRTTVQLAIHCHYSPLSLLKTLFFASYKVWVLLNVLKSFLDAFQVLCININCMKLCQNCEETA